MLPPEGLLPPSTDWLPYAAELPPRPTTPMLRLFAHAHVKEIQASSLKILETTKSFNGSTTLVPTHAAELPPKSTPSDLATPIILEALRILRNIEKY